MEMSKLKPRHVHETFCRLGQRLGSSRNLGSVLVETFQAETDTRKETETKKIVSARRYIVMLLH